MSAPAAISIEGLSKSYRIYGSPWHRLWERLPWEKRKLHQEVHALKNVSLEIPQGSCVGLVGGNGAGKSTLLKILAGTTFPTSGSYTMRGRVAALLELGAGFNVSFSGRENIFMSAALMGFSRKEAQAKYHEILDFSELHDFIHAPLRTYSSGMACRLAFSVAVATDPEVLIVDEILAVGDMHFRRKCVDRILSFRARGKTLFFCSHSLYDVRQICDRAIWMKNGEVKLYADSVEVTNEYATYENHLIAQQDGASPFSDGSTKTVGLHGEEHARILSAELVDPKTRQPRNVFAPRDDVAVRIHVKNGTRYEPLNIAVGFSRSDGTLCLAMTTEFDHVRVEANEAVVTLLLPRLMLLSGEFVVPVWLLDSSGVHRFHEQPCKNNLIVQNRDKELGLFYAERTWEVEILEGPPGKTIERGTIVQSQGR